MSNETAAASAIERLQSQYHAETKSIFIAFLELFFGRWMLICGIFFSGAFWSYMTLAKAPDTYEATGQVLIRRGELQAVRDLPIMRQQEEVGSEVDILLSIAVLDETVKQLFQKVQSAAVSDLPNQPLIFNTYQPDRPYNPLELADLPLADPAALRKWLKSSIQIRKFGESNVIEVAVVSASAVFAAEAVNTVIDVYEKFNLQVGRSPGSAAYFRQEIDKLDQEINAYSAQMATYKQGHGIGSIEKERELLTLRRYNELVRLDELQSDKVTIETDLRAVSDPMKRSSAAFLRKDVAIEKMREGLFFQQNLLAELRSKSTPDNPNVIAKLEEVEEQKRNLKTEEDLAIEQQKHLYRQVCDREKELLDKVAMLDRQLAEYPVMEAEVKRMERDIEQRTIKRIDVVERMIKSATLENPGEAMSKVRVLGYAQVPALAREARKGFKFAVALVLILVSSFVVALFVEGLDHSIRKREEIEEQLSVPYLASLSTHYR